MQVKKGCGVSGVNNNGNIGNGVRDYSSSNAQQNMNVNALNVNSNNNYNSNRQPSQGISRQQPINNNPTRPH